MQVFWEKIGILGPVYRLVGRGLSDGEIANDLDISRSASPRLHKLDAAFSALQRS